MRRHVKRALFATTAVVVIGTVGYMLLGFAPLDALYQTVTTVTTVGFREVEPLGAAGQIFTMALIVVGVGTALYSFGLLLEGLVEGHLDRYMGRRRMDRRIDKLEGHVVMCGWGRVGKAVTAELARQGLDVVIVEIDPDRVADSEHLVVVGDATKDDVLESAGIGRARALVAALTSDADNLFVTLSGRALGQQLFVVARCREESSADKLRRAGADRVVNPQEIGGARMAAFVAQPHVAEFIDVVMHDASVEYRLEEYAIAPASTLAGRRLADAGLRERTGALILAIRHSNGTLITNPDPATMLVAGQILVAIGTSEQLTTLGLLARHSERPIQ